MADTSNSVETSYVVLRRATQKSGAMDDPAVPGWAWTVENSNVPAANAEAAIRFACKTDNKPTGTYVAIPARSWKPVTVSAVQTTVLKLEGAK